MNHGLRKTMALVASLILVSAAALAVFAMPASAGSDDSVDPVDSSAHPAPPAPTNVGVTVASLTSVSVSFTGDGEAGAYYTVSCWSSVTGALAPVTGTSSPILVGGLQNLATQTVTCVVEETSCYGVVGPCSDPACVIMHGESGEGSCRTILPKVTKLSVATGEKSATVSWAPIVTDPPNCLQGYVVTPIGSGTAIESLGPSTTTVIYGLTNGASVTFTVAAADGGSIGPASDPTAPIIIGAPAAPHATTATKISGHALRVSFSPPTGNGAPVNGYGATCRSSNGGRARSAYSRTRQFTVKGLTAGKTYSCTVVAANSRGVSPASAPSARVRV